MSNPKRHNASVKIIVGLLMNLPKTKQQKELQRLKQENPAMHSLVVDEIKRLKERP